MLTPAERSRAIAEMLELRRFYRKLDMPEPMVRQFASPPKSPNDCVFAATTRSLSADLSTRITPCQFGGNPDCASCGCIASMGLAAIADHKLGGVLPVGALLKASIAVGKLRSRRPDPPPPPDNIIQIVTSDRNQPKSAA
jgi:hypothetical protein